MAKRMFVALDLPEPITVALAGLAPPLAGLRWLPVSQLHLTLVFLAAVPPEQEGRLIEALAEIREPPFSLTLKDLGRFDRNRQPAVIWVGVECGSPVLLGLRRRVLDAALAAGLTPDHKPFHPHVTVGRCREVGKAALRRLLGRHAGSDFGTFEVSGFTLYASVLHPHGPEHQAVFRRALDGG